MQNMRYNRPDWLDIHIQPNNQSSIHFLYRYLLAATCFLAAFSLILSIGFELPDNLLPYTVWLNFITICLFFLLAILRIVIARQTRSPIRWIILESSLIASLVVEFFVLNALSPTPSRYSLHVIQIYILILQFYFLFELARRVYRSGGRLFLLSFSPATTVVLSFLLLIVTGAFVLMLPRSTHGTIYSNISFIDALFTSASAVCVTGLTVVDTATTYSRLGQAIILTLIQLGAFGIMIFVGLFAFTFGSGTSLRGRIVLQDMVAKEGEQRVTSLLRTMLIATLILEIIGTLLLIPGFYSATDSPQTAVFNAAFHAVSAFCNAGFSTFSTNLETFSSSPLVVITICFLIVSGGIGFSVVYELARWIRRRFIHHKKTAQISLHSYAVLQMTGILIGFGFLIVLAGTDWTNRTPLDIALSSLFQSITPRTAGFNTIPLSAIAPWCLIVIMVLMFIGGAPGGTAGGIKVSTVSLLFHSSRCLLKGRRHVEIRNRTIGQQAIMTAFAISGLAVAYVACAVIALVWAEPQLPFFGLLFEVISAFGTVGLSLGVTPQLSPLGKSIIIITMYLGRIGPLTLFLALMRRRDEALYEYPSGSIVIG